MLGDVGEVLLGQLHAPQLAHGGGEGSRERGAARRGAPRRPPVGSRGSPPRGALGRARILRGVSALGRGSRRARAPGRRCCGRCARDRGAPGVPPGPGAGAVGARRARRRPPPGQAVHRGGQGSGVLAVVGAGGDGPVAGRGRTRWIVRQPLRDAGGGFGSGRQQAPLRLGEGADRPRDQLLHHPRYQPVRALVAHAGQGLDRNAHAHTVPRGPGRELVGHGQAHAPAHPVVGEAVPLARPARQQQGARVGEQVRARAALPLPPAVEVCGRHDVLGDQVVEEGEARLLVGHQPVGAAATLHLPGLLHELLVGALEGVALAPLALHQRVAEEHLPRQSPRRQGARAQRPRPRRRAQQPRRGRPRLVDHRVAKPAQQHRAVRRQGEAVEQDLLLDHRRALRRGPVGLGVDAFDQGARGGLDPLGADARHRAGEEARGLHQLRGHHPCRAPSHARTRPDREMGAPRALVIAFRLVPTAQVGQQAHQQRTVDLVRVHRRRALGEGHDRARRRIGRSPRGGRLGDVAARGLPHGARVDAQGAGHLAQLVHHVAPFAETQVVEELGAAQAPERRPRQVPRLHVEVAPQVHVGHEIRMGVRQARVGGVGRRLVLGGALAHVLDGQGSDDDEHLRGAPVRVRLQQHPAQARVDRQARQVPADAGEAVPGLGRSATGRAPPGSRALGGGRGAGARPLAVPGALRAPRRGSRAPAPARSPVGGAVRGQGADLDQQVHAVAHRPPLGRVHEGEVLDRPQAQRCHLQDHAGQGRAQDLRLRETGARLVIALGVQADRDAVRHAPAPARPLVRTRLADRLDRQALHLRPVRVPGDARQARVHHVADARDGQRGLRDVRRQDHPAQAVRLEHPVLLGGGQARVEGQDLDGARQGAPVLARAHPARAQVVQERRLGVPDVALARQENQDVAVALRAQLVHRVADRRLHVDVLAQAVAQCRQVVVGVLQDQLLESARPAGPGPVRRGPAPVSAGPGRPAARTGACRRACTPPGSRVGGAGLRPVGPGRRGRARRSQVRGQGAVADLDGESAPRHLDDGRGLNGAPPAHGAVPPAEVLGETRRVDRRRRDDHLQVRAGGQQARQVPQDEVDVEAALVGLVDDERVVALQHRIRLDLRQQDAVGHQFDQRGGAHLVGETHLVADHLARSAAHGLPQFGGDAVGHGTGREAPGLGVPDHPRHAAPQLQADLRQLRRLPRARLARHDHHLVVPDRLGDLVAARGHRQIRENHHRDRGGALGQLLGREGPVDVGALGAGAGPGPPAPLRAPGGLRAGGDPVVVFTGHDAPSVTSADGSAPDLDTPRNRGQENALPKNTTVKPCGSSVGRTTSHTGYLLPSAESGCAEDEVSMPQTKSPCW